jgi:3-methyladenine DNA glycosylase AlkD
MTAVLYKHVFQFSRRHGSEYIAAVPADRQLITNLRRELKSAANPQKGPGMQAYMKSSMPYYGVPSAPLGQICKAVFADHPLDNFADWRDTTLALWRGARFREERYAAIELTGHRRYRQFQKVTAMSMYEEMIVTGAWWDYVDAVAIQRIGPLLPAFPGRLKPRLRRWSTSSDMWKRRSSIICQVSAKRETDLDLLYACIEPNLDDKRFFIRKAIGWALRSYAWTDPKEIVRYVRANESRLSGLSKREALRNISGVAATQR